MSKTGDSSGFWVLVAIAIGFAMLLQAIGGGGGSSTSSTSPASGSPEHRYVRERFRQEGYNDADSRQAADAILKFHEAQKNRNR